MKVVSHALVARREIQDSADRERGDTPQVKRYQDSLLFRTRTLDGAELCPEMS